jgi:hypothetical protein
VSFSVGAPYVTRFLVARIFISYPPLSESGMNLPDLNGFISIEEAAEKLKDHV